MSVFGFDVFVPKEIVVILILAPRCGIDVAQVFGFLLFFLSGHVLEYEIVFLAHAVLVVERTLGYARRGQTVAFVGDGTPQQVLQFGDALAYDRRDEHVGHIGGKRGAERLAQFVVEHVAFAHGEYAVFVGKLRVELP